MFQHLVVMAAVEDLVSFQDTSRMGHLGVKVLHWFGSELPGSALGLAGSRRREYDQRGGLEITFTS